MLENTKVFKTKSGQTFKFARPSHSKSTDMFTEMNRRLRGANPFLPEYPLLQDRIETDVVMEFCIVEAPDRWYSKDDTEKSIIWLDNFYGDEPDFTEVREAVKVYLRQFQKPEANSETLPEGKGKAKVESPNKIPEPDASSEHRGHDCNSNAVDRDSNPDRQGTDNL